MKKNIVYAIGIILMLSLCGCNSKKAEEEAKRAEAIAEGEAKKAEDEAKKAEEEAKRIEEEAKKLEEEAKKLEEEALNAENEKSSDESYDSLADFVNGSEMAASIEEINKNLMESGLCCTVESEGENIIVFEYTFLNQLDIAPDAMDDLENTLDAELAPILAEQGIKMADEISSYGFSLKGVRVLIKNADSTEFYSKIFDI
ncbi:MAG: hypothetical protein Q4D29_02605 [Lachnospiraceae bacterium]|nr:hypothetical protein [Lachnospiraceae bacterium]